MIWTGLEDKLAEEAVKNPNLGTSLLAARVIQIMDRARELEKNALRTDINWSFAIAHSHYGDNIDLR